MTQKMQNCGNPYLDRTRFEMLLLLLGVDAHLIMPGFMWLSQRSRHCLPVRPGISSATLAQFFSLPHFSTRYASLSCSSAVQRLRVRTLLFRERPPLLADARRLATVTPDASLSLEGASEGSLS